MKLTAFFNLTLIITLLSFNCKAQSDIKVSNGETVAPINFPGTLCTYNWANDNPSVGLAANGKGSIASFTAKNTTNNPIVATITATPAISGMAYIANGYANTVSVIDLSTNTVIKTLNVGNTPSTAAVNPVNNQVYIANSASGSVSVINTINNTVKATIKVGSYPFAVYVSRDGTRAFVSNLNDNNISVINTSTNVVVDNFSAPSPFFMTSSTDDKYLYVVRINLGSNLAGLITVLDAKTGATITTLNTGVNTDPWDVNTTPDGKFAYVTNQNGSSISVINTTTNTIMKTIPTDIAPRHVVFSPDGSLFYVRVGYSNTLAVYNTADFSIKATIPLIDHGSCGLSVSPDGKRILVTNQLQSTVTVIDPATNTIIANIQTPGDESLGWGNVIMGGNDCTPSTFKITVNPSANITVNGSLSALATTYGSNSNSTTFTLTGSWLTSAITVTAPDGFEISNDGVNFSNTALTIAPTSGNAGATIYVRLSATTAVNKYSGDIIISSNAIANIKVPIPQSEVTPAALTINADNKTKFYGLENPPLTISYNGFVNNEGAKNLLQLPTVSTTAITTSAIGKYPIVVAGAKAGNYNLIYVDGVLSIVENTGVLSIPNTFTPNNDGINDTWIIKNITSFPKNTVTVYNRYGQQVFFSKGYGTPWDGRYLSKEVPDGVYYYFVDTGTPGKKISGSLTLLR